MSADTSSEHSWSTFVALLCAQAQARRNTHPILLMTNHTCKIVPAARWDGTVGSTILPEPLVEKVVDDACTHSNSGFYIVRVGETHANVFWRAYEDVTASEPLAISDAASSPLSLEIEDGTKSDATRDDTPPAAGVADRELDSDTDSSESSAK